MSVSVWVFWVISVLIVGGFSTVIWGSIQSKKSYGEGYENGYRTGKHDQYQEVYNKRLLRQSRRASREEKKNEPTDHEELDRGVQGSTESSGGEPGSGTGGLFEHDADPGAGEESDHIE